MATKDQANNLHFVPLFVPGAAVTDNTPIVSAIIDTAGYEAVTLGFVTGNNADADATFAVTIHDGDQSNLSDAAAVGSDFLIGTTALASYTFADDGECRKIGYIGSKRYVRLTITGANNTGNTFVGGLAVLGRPRNAPTANPPQ